MGQGYWILIGDGFGLGLSLIDARLYEAPDGRNWWPSKEDESEAAILRKHFGDNPPEFTKVIFDS